MIVGCIGLYGERVEQALVGIRRLRPYVDRYVVVVDESVTEEQKQLLQSVGCEVYFHPWEDSTVRMRNQYLQKCQHGDWVIVHDADEWFSESFCEMVREIVQEAEKQGVGLLLINSHDTTTRLDGRVDSSKSSFYKNLVFHYVGNVYYEGAGEGEEEKRAGWHEVLKMPPGTKGMQLPDHFWYEHVKEEHEVWERACRNVWTCGGGNDVREKNPSWKPLREICASIGIKTWPELRGYLRRGKVDLRLKEWFWENRYEGFDWQHEMMEGGRWYFEYLHPEEAEFPDGRVWKAVFEVEPGSPVEVMRYVEQCYMDVLHRHADQQGKEVYTKAILEGRLKREALPMILQQSPEYQEKFLKQLGAPVPLPPTPQPPTVPPPTGPSEMVRMPVPVNVDVRLTEDLFFEALKRSKLWWTLKPRLDVGKWLEEELGEEGWKALQERFYREPRPTLEELLRTGLKRRKGS